MSHRPSPRVVTADVPSPCVKVCVMDNAAGLCRGCRRTLDEIARWSAFSADQKRAVLQQLPGRHAGAST